MALLQKVAHDQRGQETYMNVGSTSRNTVAEVFSQYCAVFFLRKVSLMNGCVSFLALSPGLQLTDMAWTPPEGGFSGLKSR